MPVYAYDVPPHLYVRLAPGVGADVALVGPLGGLACEQILGDPRLIGGLQQSALVQVLLELSALPDVTLDGLRWTVTAMAQALAIGGVQHVALVLPAHAHGWSAELRALAVHAGLLLEVFPEQGSAVRWMATRMAGVGATSSAEEIRAAAAAGRWAEAVARYRALHAAPLATAVEAVEALLAAASSVDAAVMPTSMVPSTEVPHGEPAAPVSVIVSPTAAQDARASVAPEPPAAEPSGGAAVSASVSSSPSVSPLASPSATSATVTRASLSEHAAQASTELPPPVAVRTSEPPPVAVRTSEPPPAADLRTPEVPAVAAPVLVAPSAASANISVPLHLDFEEGMTVVGRIEGPLFAAGLSTPEGEFLQARHQGAFDALLRGLLGRTWYVASDDGVTPRQEAMEVGRAVLAHEDEGAVQAGRVLRLDPPMLGALLDDDFAQIRFCPGRVEEVTLRRQQLTYARSFHTGLQIEAALPALEGREARSAFLSHAFLVLLARGDQGEIAVLLPGDEGALAAVFTLPDALHRFLLHRPEAVARLRLGVLFERGDSLFDKLLALPVSGVVFNPAGPVGPVVMTRSRLTSMLRAEAAARSSAPPEAPTVIPPAASVPPGAGPTSTPPPGPAAAGGRASMPPGPEGARASEPSIPQMDVPTVSAPAEAAPTEAAPTSLATLEAPGVAAALAAAPVASSTSSSPAAYEVSPPSVAAMSVREGELLYGPPPVPAALHARSLAEAHFYLDMRGLERQDRYQWSEQRGAVTVWLFDTKGPDGQRHRLEFVLDATNPAPHDGYFGAGPSPLLGPVEFLTVAGNMARTSTGAPFGLSHEELSAATHRMEMAYVLVSEALRFYGPGDEGPPPESLKTDEERRLLAQDPERYRRRRVEATAMSYWTLATQLGEALRGGA